MATGPRRTIAPNILEDDIGRIGRARLAGHPRREKRFPKDTALKVIQAWIEDTRREMRKTTRRAKAISGTLAGDVVAYVALQPEGDRRRDAAALLAHWVTALGTMRRERITVEQLQAVLQQWIEDGAAASTVKHRRRELAKLWTALDGAGAGNPVRETARPREPKPLARGIDMAVAEALLDLMPDTGRRMRGFRVTPIDRSQTKARLRVMLWTGLAQATLMRVQINDINLEAGTLYVRPRRKGKGVSGATLPLLPEATVALRDFLRARAWGPFSTDAMSASFQRAVVRYRKRHPLVGLPSDLRPYDLRHSFLSEVYRRTGDLHAVQTLGQHADIRMTGRYVQAATDERAQAAIEAMTLARAAKTGAQAGCTDVPKRRFTLVKTG